MLTDINRQITEALVQRIGQHRFELWFTAPHGISVADGKIRVTAADTFSLGRIRAQFDDDLRHVQREHGGILDNVGYEVAHPSSVPAKDSVADRKAAVPPTTKANQPTATRRSRKHAESMGDGALLSSESAAAISDFAFGPQNLLVENAVKQIIARPGQISPFCLHGPVGCGKSALLSRIVQACRANNRRPRAMFVSAEQFTSQFIEALNGRGLPIFRRKYRDLDVLAIDDLQFFDNKAATIREFQSTVDQFLRDGKQIMLAADRAPAELGFLSPELMNKLSSGLVCRLNYPCQTGRTGILQRGCESRSLAISSQFVGMIAERLDGDVRQLLGAVNRLHAAHLSQMNLQQWSTIQDLLQDLFQASQRPISIESIEQAVSDFCGVATAELRSPMRSKRINVARNLAMWLSRKHTGNAFSEIGLHYGGRSHSTVISAQQKVSRWLQSGETIPLASTASCSAVDAIKRIEAKLRVG